MAGYFDKLKPQQAADTGPRPRPLAVVPAPAAGEASPYALAALRGEAEAVATAANGTRNDTLNRAAFRMGRHVGAGSIDADTVRTTLADAARQAGLPAHEIDLVLRDAANSALTQGATAPRHPTPLDPVPGATVLPGGPGDMTETPAPVPDLDPDAEEAFWTARPAIEHLRTFARARRVSPWAVLGVALARVVTATPHQVCLPPIVGGKASLNLFVGLVGRSGSGKGAAESVAADALHVGYITTHNVGSGEGIAHGYMRRNKGQLEWLDDDHAVCFSVPEIDSLAAQGDRKGATLMPQLRSGWTGEQLGFGYADPTKRIIVPAHEYRLCLVAGIQPARAACLIDDADGGTPQRFLWLPATDPDAPDAPPEEPAPITWSSPPIGDLVGVGGVRIEVCATAREAITAARLAGLRGEGDPLDGHALLARLKTAAALGLLDGRYGVTDEDWELAGVIAHKSAATRSAVVETLRAKVTAANHDRAQAEAKRAVLVEETVTEAAVRRVCGVLVRRLRRVEEEDGWLPRTELRRALASRDRQHFEDALDRLLQAGQVELDETATGHGNSVGKYRIVGDA